MRFFDNFELFSQRHVEKWLLDVEKEMKRTLRCRLREIIDDLQLEIVPLSRILKRPSQLAYLYYKLSTTSAIEMALRQRTLQVGSSNIHQMYRYSVTLFEKFQYI